MFAADLDAMFSDEEFAEKLLIVAGGVECLVIADDPVETANIGKIEAGLQKVSVLARPVDALQLPEQTLTVFRSQQYRVRRNRANGTGLHVVDLVIEQASNPSTGVWR